MTRERNAQRRRKVSRRANIRGRRPNPCERGELTSGAVGIVAQGVTGAAIERPFEGVLEDPAIGIIVYGRSECC